MLTAMPRKRQPSSELHPATIEREYFDEELLDLYWRMIAERQWMYVRRAVLELSSPWTTDSVMATEFITNMYRELDPGTQYLITNILSMKAPKDRVFNVLMYRLMGSQSETHAKIASTAAGFKLTKYMTAIGTIEKGKLFGDAYRVAGYEKYGGASKGENVGRLFMDLAENQLPAIMEGLSQTSSARDVYEVVKAIPGFGEFLAHQISVDLLYPNPAGEAIVPFGDNQWAFAGPGARNGIWAMLKPNIKPRSLLIVMEWLRDHQAEEFARAGVVFPYLAAADGEALPLSLCNIQSTLCEFYKYVRIWDGSSRAVRRYEPRSGSATIPVLPLSLTTEQLAEAQPVSCLTPPPPVGGRKLPVEAEQPAPDIDAAPEDTEPVSEPTEAVPESAVVGVSTATGTLVSGHGGGSTYHFQNGVAPASVELQTADGRAVTVNINIFLGAPPQ